jgi:subfamily B ATP-binding cassette protein MsbA
MARRLPPPGRLVRLWPRVKPHLGQLGWATLALVLSGVIGLAFPVAVRYLLDAAFVRGDRALLDRIAIVLVALFTVQAILNYVQTYFLSVVGEQVVARLRRELFGKLLDMSPGFFAERRTGELASRLTSDIALLQGVLSHQVSEFSRQVLSLTGGIILLTLFQPRLMLIALGVTPLVVGSALYFGRRLRQITTGVQDRVAEATAVAEEAFSQIRTVQSFVQEPAERMRYGDRVQAGVQTALQRARVRGLFFGVLTFTTFTGLVIVLWQGGIEVLEGRLTAGSLVMFLLYTFTIAASIGALASTFSGYQEAVGAAERVFEILDMQPAITSPTAPLALRQPVRGAVRYEDVTFQYAATGPEATGPEATGPEATDPEATSPGAPVTLEGIDLTVAPGEIVALVGPSGAGKTTLVSLLPRFWDVDRGRILLDDIDIRSLRLEELRGAIGIVPQEPALFSGTIRENIGYARPGASLADIEAAARVAHAHEFIERLGQGYDTMVGERGVKLSGGQRQRVAIARAILKDPAVLILDEATSSLDTESEQLIEDALSKLLIGRTTLIIAHRLSTVRRADRLVVLDRGRIVEEGTHGTLLAMGGLYARLYQRQFREEATLA